MCIRDRIGPIINATFGVTSLALSGKVAWPSYEQVWLIWWISNVSGVLIVTPVLLSWNKVIRHFVELNVPKLQRGFNRNHPDDRQIFQAARFNHHDRWFRLKLFIKTFTLVGCVLVITDTAGANPVSYTHLTLPTNREV